MRGNAADEVAGIVNHFEPDVVPILDSHYGDPVGRLHLVAGYLSDIWFRGVVTEAATAARLARRPLPVSLEMALAGDVAPRRDHPGNYWHDLTYRPRGFRGRIAHNGWTLIALAIVPVAGAPGSAIWIET